MHSLIADWLSEQSARSLRNVQRAIEHQNGLDAKPPVDHFLISSAERTQLAGCNTTTHEQVFVDDHPESPRMGVFIAEDVLERLHQTEQRLTLTDRRALDEYCVAAEGVSHFLYLLSRADQERRVTLLELELQAEVDKFVHLSAKLNLAAPAQHQLIEALFERYVLHDNLSPQEAERYHSASRHAARFCHRLLTRAHDTAALVRDFFALPLEGKLRLAVT